jgi:hypothetical protein
MNPPLASTLAQLLSLSPDKMAIDPILTIDLPVSSINNLKHIDPTPTDYKENNENIYTNNNSDNNNENMKTTENINPNPNPNPKNVFIYANVTREVTEQEYLKSPRGNRASKCEIIKGRVEGNSLAPRALDF